MKYLKVLWHVFCLLVVFGILLGILSMVVMAIVWSIEASATTTILRRTDPHVGHVRQLMGAKDQCPFNQKVFLFVTMQNDQQVCGQVCCDTSLNYCGERATQACSGERK